MDASAQQSGSNPEQPPPAKRLKQTRIDQLFSDKSIRSTGRPVVRNQSPRNQQRYLPVVTVERREQRAAAALTRFTSESKNRLPNSSGRPQSTEPVVIADTTTNRTSPRTRPTLERTKSQSDPDLTSTSHFVNSKTSHPTTSTKSDNRNNKPVFKMTDNIDELFDQVDDFSPDNDETQQPLKPSNNHTVTVVTTAFTEHPPLPFPGTYVDTWNNKHVRLPCSTENLLPVDKKLVSRWELVKSALSAANTWKTTEDLQAAIASYNSRNSKKWSFRVLNAFVDSLGDRERGIFFGTTLVRMAELALRLQELCTQGIPFLRQGMSHRLTMSQQQIACLMCHAFFCTFPGRNSSRQGEMESYPRINFTSLYATGRGEQAVEKLKTIVHYFQRVTKHMPTGCVTYERRSIPSSSVTSFPDWSKSKKPLKNTRLYCSQMGNIENDGVNMLQMDFANKYIGGGVLGQGCVQEEIRFLCCPELICAALFCERMADEECIIITGAERYSTYSGYGSTYEWAGTYVDRQPRDGWRRRTTRILAVDATRFGRNYGSQYVRAAMVREMNKLHVGLCPATFPRVLATGNWGCGAFGGDKQLKALLQMMVAAHNDFNVAYFTFDEDSFERNFKSFWALLVEKDVTIGQLFTALISAGRPPTTDGLFSLLRRYLTNPNATSNESSTNQQPNSTTALTSAEIDKLLDHGSSDDDEDDVEQIEDDEVPDTPPPTSDAPREGTVSVFEALRQIDPDT